MTNSIEKEATELIKKMKEWDNIQNEGSSDGYNPYRDKLETLQNKVLEAKNITWTKETTITRRENWKQWVLKAQKNGKISSTDIHQKEQEQGWVISDLKNAIKKHNL